MRWRFPALVMPALAMLAGIFGARDAQASGDFACGPSWTLSSGVYDPCNNLPFLSPTNDTRVNLRLLIADIGPAAIPNIALNDYDRSSGYGLVPFPMENLWTIPNAGGDAGQNAADTGDTSGSYAAGDGSRCRSNNADTAQAFVSQINSASGLSDAERKALVDARQNAVGVCENKGMAVDNLQSAQAKEFAVYLTGALAFYGGDFATAQQAFTGLGNSSQPWLKETALYMVARNALNAAQVNAFDEYGTLKPENTDQAQAKTAEAGFKAYLQAYPQGLYAASARGLMRRVYWLMGNQEALASTYGDAITQGIQTPDQATNLALEVDNKLLDSADPAKVKDPLLLAIIDLAAMRQSDDSEQSQGTAPAKPLTAKALQAQQPLFANRQDLYRYLVAARLFYVDKDATQTLAALPEPDTSKSIGSYLAFSAAMLRGLALEAKGDHAAAYTLWTQLFPVAKQALAQPALELALAANLQRTQKLDAVFASDSLVENAEIRSLLIRKSAGPALLRQIAKAAASPEQGDTARFVLLYKDLTRGHYQDFAGDLALAPITDKPLIADDLAYTYFGSKADLSIFTKAATAGTDDDAGYTCPTLDKVAARLQQNAKDPQGLLCLGEFIRSGFDFSPLDVAPDKDALGSTSDFTGQVFSRLNGYTTVIDDPKASRNDKAYALYRAVNCFAPSGNNGCDDQDVSKDQRKKWFQALKTRYASTPWAAKLQYYW